MLQAGQSLPQRGFRRWAPTPGVSADAANLLPGLPVATRPGLPPAGGHELVDVDHLKYRTSLRIWLASTPAGHTKVPPGVRYLCTPRPSTRSREEPSADTAQARRKAAERAA